MIEFDNAELDEIWIHYVGNKSREEGLHLSEQAAAIPDQISSAYLLENLLTTFDSLEGYQFTQTDDPELNKVHRSIKNIFANKDSLSSESAELATYLYDLSSKASIVAGDFYVCWFRNCMLDGVVTDAIGLFKNEEKHVYLNVSQEDGEYTLSRGQGVDISKIERACLIFNVEEESGYRVCFRDTKTRAASKTPQYWKNDFLNLKSAGDDYQNTNDFLSMTKEYVTNEIPEDLQTTKADKIDLLNRSVNYFKENDAFDRDDFEQTVLKEDKMIEAFRSFDGEYRNEKDIPPTDNFDISEKAVKKQVRNFRRVLKLDKNFHIYIHGDRRLIEQGTEDDGRKFYKMYFDNEA